MKREVLEDRIIPMKEGLEEDSKLQMRDLRGKTIEVYEYMISGGRQFYGVREIQRDLEYSSPSIASYHLNRLCEYNLAGKSADGLYFIEGDSIKLGSMETHVRVLGLMIPRLIIYGINSLFAIAIAILLYSIRASQETWLGFILITNLLFIAIIISDSFKISGKLKINESSK